MIFFLLSFEVLYSFHVGNGEEQGEGTLGTWELLSFDFTIA